MLPSCPGQRQTPTPAGNQKRDKIKWFSSSRCAATTKPNKADWSAWGKQITQFCAKSPPKKGQLEKRGLHRRGDAGKWLKCDRAGIQNICYFSHVPDVPTTSGALQEVAMQTSGSSHGMTSSREDEDLRKQVMWSHVKQGHGWWKYSWMWPIMRQLQENEPV